jgi:peptidyl-prolyl cis-trans isomerase A (cyclophilin A)
MNGLLHRLLTSPAGRVALLPLLLSACHLRSHSEQPALPRVELRTDAGDIVLEVDTLRAKISALNFLRYVDSGLYNGGQFHRAVTAQNQPGAQFPIEIIQASIDSSRSGQSFGTIPLETTNQTGLHHFSGCLSFARAAQGQASSDFFICVSDQPDLDFGGRWNPDGQGFAAFGKVLQGMDVVRRIHRSPTDGQRLNPTVRILQARRLPRN